MIVGSLGSGVRRFLRAALAGFALTVACAHAASAQQGASIIGTVTDDTGGAMPGVTITATSPSLQVPSVTAVTDERGEYRITPLPIGLYSLDYELSGFSTVKRDAVRLTVGFTARIDVALKVGGLEESITVSGAAPVVDVSSGSTATTFTRETLEVTPTSRNGLIGLMAQAPGVRTNADVGGSIAVATVPLNVSGTLKDPVLTPTGAAVAGAVAGAAVLGPVGSALGTKAGAFVDKLFSRKSDAK